MIASFVDVKLSSIRVLDGSYQISYIVKQE